MQGFITSLNGGLYIVYDGKNFYRCKARGLFRLKEISPMVGDNVDFEPDGTNNGSITDVKPRVNQLIRPPLANVEQVVIIVSLSHPKISLGLVSRYIVVSSCANLKPIILINKVDRDDLEQEYYDHVYTVLTGFGYQVIPVSAKSGFNLELVKSLFIGKKTVITGQSGVGKSTLLNKIFDNEKLETNEISVSMGRGKHTTRVVEYFKYGDAFIADTPGFSYIEFTISTNELACIYPGFEPYLNVCKFRGCLHEHEIGCGVKKDVEKGIIARDHYEDYLSLLEEFKNRKERY